MSDPQYGSVLICVKCGRLAEDAESKYWSMEIYPNRKETIIRTCTRCGFTWNEEPLDHEQAKRNKERTQDDEVS